jgi:(+)-trans-carveol dehydrogenase
MIDINLTGVWHTVKAAIRHLRAGGRGGSIILTSSTAGLMAKANIGHYVAAKHGVVGLMRTLALELAPDMIRVNSVHPTTVDTDMIQNAATYARFAPDLPEQDRTKERLTEGSRRPTRCRSRGPSRWTFPTPCCGWPRTRPVTSPG